MARVIIIETPAGNVDLTEEDTYKTLPGAVLLVNFANGNKTTYGPGSWHKVVERKVGR